MATKNCLIVGNDLSRLLIYREDKLETSTIYHWDNLPGKLTTTRANFPGELCEGLRYVLTLFVHYTLE